MSMTIPTTALPLGLRDADDVIDSPVTAPAGPRPHWSLTGTFDDRDFAESLGVKPILAA